MTKTLIRVLGVVMVVAVFAMSLIPVAAQDPTAEPTEDAMAADVEPIELPEVDPLSVMGDIITAGSSTVFPLTNRMAEAFEEEGYVGTITVDSIGTGAGFERFCVSAEIDIANASRPIRDSEVEECNANGREPLEFRVGTDALAVAVSQQNDFATNLTVQQLGAIFAGEYTNWNQVDASYPDLSIVIFSPGTDSGTFDYFVEAVMLPYAESQGVADDEATEDDEIEIAAENYILNPDLGTQFSENDNVLVEGIQGDPGAIGYFGFAYLQESSDVVRALTVEGVEPNEESAESGDYILSRPLFIYSDATIMQEKPQVADFINFYLSNVDTYVLEVGYFPASVEALNEAKQHWLDATAAE